MHPGPARVACPLVLIEPGEVPTDNAEIPPSVTSDAPRLQNERGLLDHHQPQPVLRDQRACAGVVEAALLAAAEHRRRCAGGRLCDDVVDIALHIVGARLDDVQPRVELLAARGSDPSPRLLVQVGASLNQRTAAPGPAAKSNSSLPKNSASTTAAAMTDRLRFQPDFGQQRRQPRQRGLALLTRTAHHHDIVGEPNQHTVCPRIPRPMPAHPPPVNPMRRLRPPSGRQLVSRGHRL